MNTRSTNDSNFRYGHFTKFCLEIFDKIPVLEPIESSHIQEVYPSTSLDESSIEFEFETDRSIYLDMRDIHLQIKVGLQKGRLFYDCMKKQEHGKPDMGMTFTDDDLQYLTHVNNLLHSLFSNCEVYLNNQQVYNSNGLYGHKALISNEFNASTMNNEGILACHGCEFEKNPGNYEKSPFIDNTKSSFTNFLPEQINLEGEWEVAITELSYPSLYQNITDGKFFYLDAATPDTKPSAYYTIDAELYPSISDIVNEMNNKIQEKQKYEKTPIK